MITKRGLDRNKKLIIKMAIAGDDEWNAILQAFVVQANRLAGRRFPPSKPTP